MKKKYIKIPKGFFKDLTYKVAWVEHSTEPICFCFDCIARRQKERQLLNILTIKYGIKK